MRLVPFLSLAILVALGQGTQRGVQQNDEFKISTDVVLVLLDASVKDVKGGYVSGLGRENFRVYESGVLQNISVFSNADVPVAAGLVVDQSGSMRPNRADVITAGLAFAEASNPQDQIFVVNFNDKVRRGLPNAIPFTGDAALLSAALSKDPSEGMTALYDAIAYSLRHLDTGQRDKKTLVVVSDGGDTCSKTTLPELMRMIEESHATIYTIGLFEPDDPDRNPAVLRRIASASGGECFLPRTSSQIVTICRQIAKDIRTRYTIGYTPDSGDRTGVHKIHVTASAAGRGKLVVRTRSGYATPAKAAGTAEPRRK